jgi:hypothetical protein
MVELYRVEGKSFKKFYKAVDYWLLKEEESNFGCDRWFSLLRTIKAEDKEEWIKEALTDIRQFHCWKCGIAILEKQRNLVNSIEKEIIKYKCYSYFWRINRSTIEYVELANLLLALRKIVGCLGLGVRVEWIGDMPLNPLASKKLEKIEIPIQLAMGEYPVPFYKVDILSGMVIHDALHLKEKTEQVAISLISRYTGIRDRLILRKFFDVAEDIHIDGVAIINGILGNYVRLYRKWFKENINPSLYDYQAKIPTAEKLIYLWEDIALDVILANGDLEVIKIISRYFQGNETLALDDLEDALPPESKIIKPLLEDALKDVNKFYWDPLKILLEKIYEIIITEGESRAKLYDCLWSKIQRYLFEWEEQFGPKEKIEVEREKNQTNIPHFAPFDPELLKAVNSAIEKNSKEITLQIKDALDLMSARVNEKLIYSTIIEESNILPKYQPDPTIVGELKEIFRMHREDTLRISRGLPHGKLDCSRLYRAYTTGLSFKQSDTIRDDKWSITLLIDASGSMITNWSLIEKIFLAIYQAIIPYNHKLEILAYNEINEICILTRLFHHNKIFSIAPQGNTPSGEACLGAAKLIEGSKRSLLLHLSDGLCNVGVGYNYAIDYCEKKDINLITIGKGEKIRRLKEKYGTARIEIIDNYEELPVIIQRILRRKLLKRKILCV